MWLLLAGRGFGKTRTGVEWAREQAEAGKGPGAIVGRTAADVRDVLIEGPAGLMACSPPWFKPIYEPSKRRITWPNGVYALTFSAEEPDQLRGPQHAWALGDEFAAWARLGDAWSNLQMGLRLGRQPQVALMTTPRPLPIIRQLVAEKGNAITRGGTRDNFDNLAKSAVEDLEKRFKGTRLGRQELDGEILDDVPGALWTRAMLQAAVDRGYPYGNLVGRGKQGKGDRTHDLFSRIVVGVDPSGSDGSERGDFIGIVTAGRLRESGHAVVLRDRTVQARPEEWAKIVVAEYDFWEADSVVAEANFGGDMVRAVVQSAADRPIPVKMVTASRGKHVRAEPVSRLYEQERVHHAKALPQLDDELCFFTPNGYMDDTSPNRADAMVWAITDLMLLPTSEPKIRRIG